MTESQIEQHLVIKVKQLGGIAYKFNSGQAGVPDRLVLLPNNIMFFVELKAPGKKPRKLQEVTHRKIRNLGFKVYVVDSKERVEEILSNGI